MSTINGLGRSMNMMMMSAMRRPDKEQMFVKIDADGSGAINQSELTTFAENISKMTGETINVEEALDTYDTDSDGGLSRKEMDSMMKDKMAGGKPPMPPSQQVLAAYSQNSGNSNNLASTLFEMFGSSTEGKEYSPFKITV